MERGVRMSYNPNVPDFDNIAYDDLQKMKENFQILANIATRREDILSLAVETGDILDSRIVEHNLNILSPSNGYYIRWENGLQVCMAKVEVDFTSTGFKNFPYPAEFFESPWGGSFATGAGTFSSPDDPSRFSMSTLRLGGNAWEFRVNEVFSETNRPTRFFAIGRWK
jgi:hypothetical protein